MPLLVEGEKDVAALRNVGIAGAIERVQGAGAVFPYCETLSHRGVREVAILTDWDRAGGRLARLLREGLAANGVKADLDLRRALVHAAREIRHVESLDTYLETVRRRTQAR